MNTKKEDLLLKKAKNIGNKIKKHAKYYDANPQYQKENFELLKANNFLKLALPKPLGGIEASLKTILKTQIEIAKGDASTALGIGMHHIVCGYENESNLWPVKKRREIFRSIITNHYLINNIASEEKLGSPKGGGKPKTKVYKDKNGILKLKGEKNWATLSSGLDLLIVYAYNAESKNLCRVLVDKNDPNISINNSWDGLGMRSSESHEIIFNNVIVNNSNILYEYGKPQLNKIIPFNAWFPLMIGSISLGIAIEAKSKLIEFLNKRKPTGYKNAISEIPFIKHQLGAIDAKIMISRNFLLNTAEAWSNKRDRKKLVPYVIAAKRDASETGVYVTDVVMRLVGGIGLERQNEFERLFRDARSGLINPPIEARALESIADSALTNKNNDFLL
tara:strand:- start:3350 stop:4522 length:1173 start_codon:yes stop_codon:yes gene_type:complete